MCITILVQRYCFFLIYTSNSDFFYTFIPFFFTYQLRTFLYFHSECLCLHATLIGFCCYFLVLVVIKFIMAEFSPLLSVYRIRLTVVINKIGTNTDILAYFFKKKILVYFLVKV